MTDTEPAAWQSFVLVTHNFFGNRKSENYQESVDDLLPKFNALGVKVSVKIHYLFSYLHRFLATLVIQVKNTEKGSSTRTFRSWKRRTRACGMPYMTADYCSGHILESLTQENVLNIEWSFRVKWYTFLVLYCLIFCCLCLISTWNMICM